MLLYQLRNCVYVSPRLEKAVDSCPQVLGQLGKALSSSVSDLPSVRVHFEGVVARNAEAEDAGRTEAVDVGVSPL